MMHRKISHIFLFVMLLTATTGLAVSKHFCNESLISSAFYSEADSCCDDNCCRDNLEFIQLDEKFQVSESSAVPGIIQVVLLFRISQDLVFLFPDRYVQALKTENEPPPPGLPVFLSLRQTYLL
jgi:hypothetical protein